MNFGYVIAERNGWSPRLATSDLPGPEQPEPLTVPTNHGSGLTMNVPER
jgi:hypothetical protein